jgi:putative peptidoglycan lipid II flippase
MVAAADMEKVRSTIAHAISLMMLLNVPATVGLVVLAEPIVRVIFERGNFTPADTLATASALRFYAIGLLGYSVVRIVSPVFYALGRSRTPVMVSAGSVVVNAALNLALVQVLGFRGLALGTSLAAMLNAGTQIVLLRSEIGGIEGRMLARSFVKTAIAALIMAVAAAGADRLLSAWLPGETTLMQSIRLGWTIGLSLVVLTGAAWALRIAELDELWALLARRLRRSS